MTVVALVRKVIVATKNIFFCQLTKFTKKLFLSKNLFHQKTFFTKKLFFSHKVEVESDSSDRSNSDSSDCSNSDSSDSSSSDSMNIDIF